MTTAKELYNEVFRIIYRHDDNSDEYDRVFDEITLIGTRGWEPFILLLSEVMNQKGSWPIEMSGSALDSYILYLATNSVIGDDGEKTCARKNNDKLNDQKGRGFFFNDALRLNVDVISAMPDVVDTEVGNLLDCIRSKAERLDLTVCNLDETGLWLAVGKGKEIPDSDVETLKNEKTESTNEEAEILHKYLLIRIRKRNDI